MASIQLSTHIPVPTWLMMRSGPERIGPCRCESFLWIFLLMGFIKGKPHTNAAGSEILWGQKGREMSVSVSSFHADHEPCIDSFNSLIPYFEGQVIH